MTRALLRRELTLAVRDAGLRHALFGHLAALVVAALPLYLGVTGAAATGPGGEPPAARLMAVQWVLACALAPWAMLRLGGAEQGGALVGLIALSGRRPWQVVLARWAAGALYLLGLLIAALPAVFLASMVGATGAAAILGAYLELFLFLALVGLAAFHCGLGGRPGLPALGLAYLTLFALAAGRAALLAAAGRTATTAAVLAAALGLGLWLAARSGRRLLHLDARLDARLDADLDDATAR